VKTGFIDWEEDNLNFYVFEKKGGQYELSDSRSFPVEDRPDPLLLQPLVQGGFETLCLSIPLNRLTLREQTFPFSDKDKISDTISFELEGLLLGNTADYSIDHVVTETTDAGSMVLAVCIEKSGLREIIDTFSSAGMDPNVITCIDLWLYGGNAENTLEKPLSDKSLRAETAKQELMSPSINMRQGDLAYTGDVDRFRKSLRFSSVLVLILAILCGVYFSLQFLSAKKEHEALEKQINSIYRGVFPEDKKIISAERQFKGNMNSLKKRQASLGGIPVLDILQDIAIQEHKDITLHEFGSDGKNIRIKGNAISFENVESLKNSLSALFRNVKVADSTATADNKIDFTIVMQEKTV
jgi:type II secretory pathway component PulL